MSGGSWDYLYRNIGEAAQELMEDKRPLRRAFGKHMELISKAMYAIEWVDSSDWGAGQEEKYIRKALGDNSVVLELEELMKQVMDSGDKLKNIGEAIKASIEDSRRKG